MPVIVPECTCCWECKYFQRIKSDNFISPKTFLCLAYPDGIPKDYFFEEKKEGQICKGGLIFEEHHPSYGPYADKPHFNDTYISIIKSKFGEYPVFFTTGLDCQNFTNYDLNNTFFVIDSNVYDLYKNIFSLIKRENIFLIEALEKNKNIDTVLKLVNFFSNLQVDKSSKIVCFGGGITQEITSFACNIFLRGIKWEFFPTTLLAMSDSCIGGKCSLNYEGIKNHLGVFYPPSKIRIDTYFLKTLKKDDIINGWGEIFKSCLLNEKFAKEIFSIDFNYEDIFSKTDYTLYSFYQDFISYSLRVKKYVIEKDELEGRFRMILNYGHTFGHALESYTNNSISHGKAVLWGIDVINFIAFKKNIMNEEDFLKIRKYIYAHFLDIESIKIDNPNELFKFVKKDKKVRNDKLYVVYLEKIGSPIIIKEDIGELEKIFLGAMKK